MRPSLWRLLDSPSLFPADPATQNRPKARSARLPHHLPRSRDRLPLPRRCADRLTRIYDWRWLVASACPSYGARRRWRQSRRSTPCSRSRVTQRAGTTTRTESGRRRESCRGRSRRRREELSGSCARTTASWRRLLRGRGRPPQTSAARGSARPCRSWRRWRAI